MNSQSTGLELIGPPWSQLTAYDLNKGTIAWQVPHGEVTALSRQGKTGLGSQAPRGGVVVTAGGWFWREHLQIANSALTTRITERFSGKSISLPLLKEYPRCMKWTDASTSRSRQAAMAILHSRALQRTLPYRLRVRANTGYTRCRSGEGRGQEP